MASAVVVVVVGLTKTEGEHRIRGETSLNKDGSVFTLKHKTPFFCMLEHESQQVKIFYEGT